MYVYKQKWSNSDKIWPTYHVSSQIMSKPPRKTQVFKNGPTPDSFFIFVLFKHKFTDKTLGFSLIRTRIVGVEGAHSDHLTTTTASSYPSL